MKNILAVLCGLVLVLSLAACNKDEEKSRTRNNGDADSEVSAVVSEEIGKSDKPVKDESSEEAEAEGLLIYRPDSEYMDYETVRIPFEGDMKALVAAMVENGGLPEGCTLNHYSINGDTAYLDMNKAYFDYMCMGTAAEAFAIDCLVNTVITYYKGDGIKKVMITVDDEYIETGHAGRIDYPFEMR